MKNKSKRILIAALAVLTFGSNATSAPLGEASDAPETAGMSRTLTLGEVIGMAQSQSPDAVAARGTYESAYWTYRNYRADNLPTLSLGSNPYLNRTTDYVTLGDGSVSYVKQNNVKTDLSLNVTQNVWFTGGTFQVSSTARRLDLLGTESTTYNVQPLYLTYQQSLFGYNALKWNRRIEPVRFREARKQYAETMELVAAQAANYFFSLAAAQTNLEIALTNQAAADTLYRFALGRYHIGTITENELLQLEVNKLNEETNVLSAQISVDDAMDNLRSYLNIKEAAALTVVTDDSVPQFTVPLADAMALAIENNPDIEYMKRQRIQSESNLAYAKANAGLKANIYVQLGLAQTGDDFRQSYNELMDEQYVSVSLSLPILDWGKGRGQVRVARSNLELTNTRMDQNMLAFEQNVQLVVKQFNLQARRVDIAHRTMETAAHRYDVARQLYVMGKSTILDLNSAISEKDSAYRSYVSSLANYWTLYYTLRSLTRYDFEHNLPLEYCYENIEKN